MRTDPILRRRTLSQTPIPQTAPALTDLLRELSEMLADSCDTVGTSYSRLQWPQSAQVDLDTAALE